MAKSFSTLSAFGFGVFFLGLTLAATGCETCPDGGSGNSLYCNSGAACSENETTCGGACSNLQSDSENCGACGQACGDGMSCYSGVCASSCASANEMSCGGTCFDTSSDESHCGTCTTACKPSETCTDGSCGCTASQVACGVTCVDPQTDKTHCGATGDCLGANAGTTCEGTQSCIGGRCLSTEVYRGSLPNTTGAWTYNGVIGLPGAVNECNNRVRGTGSLTQVCTYAQLTAAQAAGELINAKDYNGVAVTEWWVNDITALGNVQCNDINVNWNYATAHLGPAAKSTTLAGAAGTISPVNVGTAGVGGLGGSGITCNTPRAIPCCTAP